MKLVYVTGKESIRPYEDVVWDMLQRSYEDKRGYRGLRHKQDIRTCSLLKLVWSYDNDRNDAIGACALYKYRDEGFRNIGYAGNSGIVPDYKECVQEIIKDDIAPYDRWFWAEASGAIEHYFEKHGGYAIPNIYVEQITGKTIPQEDLLPDGFRYNRLVGTGDSAFVEPKQLFGFANKSVFDGLMAIYGGLDNFTKAIKELKAKNPRKAESAVALDARTPEDVRTALLYIYNLEDCVVENNLYEVPREWIQLLDYAETALRTTDCPYSRRAIEDGITTADTLKDTLSIITLGVIRCDKPLPHIVEDTSP